MKSKTTKGRAARALITGPSLLAGLTEPKRVDVALDVHAVHCVLGAMLRPLVQRLLNAPAPACPYWPARAPSSRYAAKTRSSAARITALSGDTPSQYSIFFAP